jgi:hypothetical protein
MGKTKRDLGGALGAPGEQSGKKEFSQHERGTSGNRKRIWAGEHRLLSK